MNSPEDNGKKILVGVLAAGTLLFLLIVILCGAIPGKASAMLSEAVASAEERIEQMYPGYTDEILDKSEFETLIGNGIAMSETADTSIVLSQIFNLPAVGPVKKAVDAVLDGTDAFIDEFDASGTPFTLHNILQAVHKEVMAGVERTAGVAKTIVAVIAILFYIISFSVYIAHCKGLFKPKNSSLNFGDGA